VHLEDLEGSQEVQEGSLEVLEDSQEGLEELDHQVKRVGLVSMRLTD
jgi:hypothetical protein